MFQLCFTLIIVQKHLPRGMHLFHPETNDFRKLNVYTEFRDFVAQE